MTLKQRSEIQKQLNEIFDQSFALTVLSNLARYIENTTEPWDDVSKDYMLIEASRVLNEIKAIQPTK